MADTPEKETPVQLNMTDLGGVRVDIPLTRGDTTIVNTTIVEGIGININHRVTTPRSAIEHSMSLILNGKVAIEINQGKNTIDFRGILDKQTTENVIAAVVAIHASGGVSAVESERADQLRQLITNSLMDDNKFSEQEMRAIDIAAVRLKNSALPKDSRGK